MFRQAAGEDTVNISVVIGGDFQKHHNRYYCAKAQSLTGSSGNLHFLRNERWIAGWVDAGCCQIEGIHNLCDGI